MKTFFLILLSFITYGAVAQSNIDVQHYHYTLTLSDAWDTIKGTAAITVKFTSPSDKLLLNLAASNKEGKGMQVTSVISGNTTFSFTHAADLVSIALPKRAAANEVQTFYITYAGIPADGLIISKNKWGDRTFFGDNWPNRAQHWLPCNDVPADKATVAFTVIAPAHYKVVANGLLKEEKSKNELKETTWQETVPIPTKVMVIGAARFAVKEFKDSTSQVPVSAWVYPQDSTNGFYDFALATSILHFFNSYIGAYPFEKLANVQSTTIFGGMENAGAIFYDENTITGTRQMEDLLAHEIVHQWFGDMATEKSFAHLWLSEGFATYLTDVYIESKYGRDSLVKRLKKERAQVAKFQMQSTQPVVDSTSNLMDLLNANSYQKGAWVLHMLRTEVGDTLFQKVIQAYYNQYKGSNSDTWGFQKVAEQITGKDLSAFFRQWLYTPGIPQLKVSFKNAANKVQLTILQTGKHAFIFPLEIGVIDKDNKQTIHQMQINNRTQTFTLPHKGKATSVILDPETKLLFAGNVTKAK